MASPWPPSFAASTWNWISKKRIAEYTESIEQAQNLKISSFFCRYLSVDDVWIPLGESLLINHFAPIWNLVIDGFGNHDPGGGRRNQMKSSWDVLHPGRPWAEKQKDNSKSAKQILDNLAAFIAGRPAQVVEQPDETGEADSDGPSPAI
jgi:Eco29kI restriction endonuclease